MDLFDIDEAKQASDKKIRIKELEKLIKKYQDSYYNGEAQISDAEFDKLWDELKSLDSENPVLHKIGADSGNFAKIRHVMPMGSQEKAANPEQFLSWCKNHSYPEYLVEFKLDGASLELQYSQGKLIHAVTRGDGSIGDDITKNAVKMQGVKKNIDCNFTGGIRGEVIMTHKVHQDLFSDKANCRNAANGLMKRKDGTGSEYLSLIVYDVWATDGNQPYTDEEDKLAWLKKNGFTAVELYVAKSPEDVIDYRVKIMDLRKSLDYDIDGLVVKERVVNHEDALRDRPDRQIAFKFSLEEAVSVVRSVEWNESGATYTPVAVFDPVDLNGTTVQRASLANPNIIKNLGLKIGSHVVVVKRGEIIPKIEKAFVPENDAEKLFEIEMPEKCETCGSTLIDEGTRLYCPSANCPKKVLHQIMKWISVVDIRDLGESLIKSLFSSGAVKSISDLYRLDVQTLRPYFLNEESLVSEKKSLGAEKVFASIQNHRTVSLSKFIAGFDIEGIGVTIVDNLVQAGYGTLEKLFSATKEQIAAIYGFADIMAQTFVRGMKDNESEMKNLVSSGTIILQEQKGGKLEGKSFCFTGELLTMKRQEAQNLVQENGGSVKSSVVKGLSYLVTNDSSSGSSKNKKAAELGIPVISEKDFLAML